MRKGSKHTPETREKIRQYNIKWCQDPAQRAHLVEIRKLALAAPRKKPIETGRPKGVPHSPEVRERLRQHAIKRCEDPVYRARLIELGKLARAARPKKPAKPKRPHAGRPRIRPQQGTPEYQWYRKVALCIGIEAARSLGLGDAT